MDKAVILDVDGVLLDLTPPEEDAFFRPFESLYDMTGLSRDWDSYRIRNDCDIIAEILENHFGYRPLQTEIQEVISAYIGHLSAGIAGRSLQVEALPGAKRLLENLLAAGFGIGIATANLLEAARLRLEAAGLWHFVGDYPFGAAPGGPKRDVLARAIDGMGLSRERIIYIGDNLNDVDAGLANGVHFIGFSVSEHKRKTLAAAGARHTAGDHDETWQVISGLM